MVHPDNTLIEVPIVLRDLIAANRLHARQPYYEVMEEALLFWLERGGWSPTLEQFTDIPAPVPRLR